MWNICSATCAKRVRKDYLSCICVQMLQISRYLLVRGVKGAGICVIRCAILEFSGLTPSLLAWCGFSEFHVIRGSCGRTA